MRELAAVHHAVDDQGFSVRLQLESGAPPSIIGPAALNQGAMDELLTELALISEPVHYVNRSAVGGTHLGCLFRQGSSCRLVNNNEDRKIITVDNILRASPDWYFNCYNTSLKYFCTDIRLGSYYFFLHP